MNKGTVLSHSSLGNAITTVTAPVTSAFGMPEVWQAVKGFASGVEQLTRDGALVGGASRKRLSRRR